MAKIKGAPAPHKGHAAGSTDIEKAASQLVSDVKYKVKKELSKATHLNPAQVAAKYLQKLNQSAEAGTSPAVIALARKKLSAKTVKEEIMNSVDAKDMATDTIANALYKVFVEKKETNIEEQIEDLKEFYSKVNKKGERLYHVIVRDKKTGNTYTRDATREKIAELRANPNIDSVEMSERQLDSKKEKTKGANTAAVKSGKGLDPVGKEDGDIDNDGDKDKSDEYLLNRRKVRGSAIAKRSGVKEEFIGEVNTEKVNPDSNSGAQIKPMKGTNTVVINPEVPGSSKNMFPGVTGRFQLAHYDMQGNPLSESQAKFAAMIQEKAESEQQQKLFGLALSVKRGQTPRSEVSAEVLKIVDTMSEKKIRDFAKTKHEGLPKKKPVEEAYECGDDDASRMNLKKDKKMDPRSIPTEVSLAKLGARYRGAKNPIVMVATEQVKKGTDYLGRDAGGSDEEHASNVRFGKAMEKLQGAVNPKPGSLSRGLIKPAN